MQREGKAINLEDVVQRAVTKQGGSRSPEYRGQHAPECTPISDFN